MSLPSCSRYCRGDGDLDRCLVQIVQPDPDGGGPLTAPIWSFAYDDSGLQISATDPEGRVTTSTYDALGRLETVTGPDPGGEELPSFVQFAYDRAGNLRFVREMLDETRERITERIYDNRNRMTQLIEPDPDGDPETGLAAPVTHFAFDAAGQLLVTVKPLLACFMERGSLAERWTTARSCCCGSRGLRR